MSIVNAGADADRHPHCGCGCGSSMIDSIIHFLFTLRMRMRMEYELGFSVDRMSTRVLAQLQPSRSLFLHPNIPVFKPPPG